MAKDVQNQQLAEWLQLMGCPLELSSEDLQNLNSANMRSIWRHLQRHVKPVSTIRIIKKNLLLQKLRTNGLLLGKFGNFKIETVQELARLQKHSTTQEEVDLLKGKIRSVDESLLSAFNSLTTKVTEKERMITNLKELQQKETLLNLKLTCLQADIEKLDKELEVATVLKTCPTTYLPYLETKENKLLVAKYVQKFSSVEITDDCIVEMIISTSEFPPSLIFDGILSVSNHALKTLNSSKTAGVLSNLPNKLNNSSSSKHSTDLSTTLFKNEVEFHNSSRKITASKVELDKERVVLCTIIGKAVTSENSQDSNLVDLIDSIVENTLVIKREETLKELLDELHDVCSSDFEQTKWMVKSCKEKEDKLLTEVNEKLSNINKLIEQISTIQVSFVKATVLLRATDLVSKFLTQLKHYKDKENPCQVLVSENLIYREIEMFQKLPLVAMTRQWEDSLETIPKTIRDDILKAPESLSYLYQSESKNLIKNIVEKTFWLHTNLHQFSH